MVKVARGPWVEGGLGLGTASPSLLTLVREVDPGFDPALPLGFRQASRVGAPGAGLTCSVAHFVFSFYRPFLLLGRA